MKLDIRLEDNNPIIFLLDFDNYQDKIHCYNLNSECNMASRAYMRSLKKPESKADLMASWQLLQHYATLVLKFK